MSKKTLNVDALKNELEGASLYFSPPSTPPPPANEPLVPTKFTQPHVTKKAPEIKVRLPKVKKVRYKFVEQELENEPTNQLANEPSFERTNQRTNVLPKSRTKIRHTFDIFADQLLSLREIAIEQEKMFGERVLLGELAQQALDMFITKEKNK